MIGIDFGQCKNPDQSIPIWNEFESLTHSEKQPILEKHPFSFAKFLLNLLHLHVLISFCPCASVSEPGALKTGRNSFHTVGIGWASPRAFAGELWVDELGWTFCRTLCKHGISSYLWVSRTHTCSSSRCHLPLPPRLHPPLPFSYLPGYSLNHYRLANQLGPWTLPDWEQHPWTHRHPRAAGMEASGVFAT